MCICNSEITENGKKTPTGALKGQMLTVKRCPHSNEAPGAMFWSERLKWVQWIALAATFRILKVTLFKKATLLQNEGISGENVAYSHARPQVGIHTRCGGVISGRSFKLTFLEVHTVVDLYVLMAACISVSFIPSKFNRNRIQTMQSKWEPCSNERTLWSECNMWLGCNWTSRDPFTI